MIITGKKNPYLEMSTTDIAIYLKVGCSTLQSAIMMLEDFPRPHRRYTNGSLFVKADILAWCKGKDAEKIIKQAHAKRCTRLKKGDEPESKFNRPCSQFISGKFDPCHAKERHAEKRYFAANFSARPKTVLVRVESQW